MERRKAPRYPLSCDIEAVPSTTGPDQEPAPETIHGTVVNFSAGGACLLGERSLEPFSVLPCQFRFPGVPASIPVLTQVRWVEAVESQEGVFRIGLHFMF